MNKVWVTIALGILALNSHAQCWALVWDDEFAGTSLDLGTWSYQTGGDGWGNNELQYYTAGDNVEVSNGTLKIVAQTDASNSYPNNDYTSSRIRSIGQGDWRYGRFEARVKLPPGQGLWPAFWMMPTAGVYGGWPTSGEIDIMEYLGHTTTTAYGYAHYGNSPVDKSSSGTSVTLTSGTFSDDFHIFKVVWEPGEIRWYLDEVLFHTLSDQHPDFNTYMWPFDQEFHFILNLAVGGNWPGAPDLTTNFPQAYEIDWVRVYQDVSNLQIVGNQMVLPGEQNVVYSIPDLAGATYSWTVPANATLVNGQGTNEITVNWTTSGNAAIAVELTSDCGTETFALNVAVTPNQWANYGFESRWINWSTNEFNGANADFDIISTNVSEGNNAVHVKTTNLADNPWDIQLGRPNVALTAGTSYTLRFWARSDQSSLDVNLGIINNTNYDYYAGTSFPLTTSWAPYSYVFTAPTTAIALFNLDLGDELGDFYFDDFFFAKTALLPVDYLHFEVSKAPEGITAKWTTEQEQNVNYFELERSPDLNRWEKIAQVTAKGSGSKYTTIDADPQSGINYYRIKAIDFDAVISYSMIRSIRLAFSGIQLFPNPIIDQLHIVGGNIQHIHIYQTDGQLVLTQQVDPSVAELSISLAALPSGIYFIQLSGKDKVDGFQVVKE